MQVEDGTIVLLIEHWIFFNTSKDSTLQQLVRKNTTAAMAQIDMIKIKLRYRTFQIHFHDTSIVGLFQAEE